MNWFRQNRFLGTFLIVFGLATIASAFFLLSAKSGFDDAQAQFSANSAELSRLQRMTPFPTEANLQKMKTQAQEYAADLNKLKEDLKARVLPQTPMAPNEFQARLNQAKAAITEKARANKVKLPDNFLLGFDEFAAALPATAAAPLLGQQLAQAELLLNILIDARVEAVTSFRRIAAPQPTPAPLAPSPTAVRKPPVAAGPALVERNSVDASFLSSPSAARRVLNQIATNNQQFFIVRTLQVLNEKDKGPSREGSAAPAGAPPSASARAAAPATSALNFIVGTERVQTSARIEMVRFTF